MHFFHPSGRNQRAAVHCFISLHYWPSFSAILFSTWLMSTCKHSWWWWPALMMFALFHGPVSAPVKDHILIFALQIGYLSHLHKCHEPIINISAGWSAMALEWVKDSVIYCLFVWHVALGWAIVDESLMSEWMRTMIQKVNQIPKKGLISVVIKLIFSRDLRTSKFVNWLFLFWRLSDRRWFISVSMW